MLDCGCLAATFNEESICFSYSRDVMICTRFPHYWSFVGGIQHRPMASLYEDSAMGSIDVFFVISMSVLLTKFSSCGWFEMQRYLCEVIVMYWYMYCSVPLWHAEIFPNTQHRYPIAHNADIWGILCSTLDLGFTPVALFTKNGLTLVPGRISNHFPYAIRGEISYLFPNCSSCAGEVWEWISSFISHFTDQVITYPCWDLSESISVKEAPWHSIIVGSIVFVRTMFNNTLQ